MKPPVFRSQKAQSEGEKPVKSPCVSVCVLNDSDVCTGCYRSGDEISAWGKLSSESRQLVLTRCRERARAMNPYLN